MGQSFNDDNDHQPIGLVVIAVFVVMWYWVPGMIWQWVSMDMWHWPDTAKDIVWQIILIPLTLTLIGLYSWINK